LVARIAILSSLKRRHHGNMTNRLYVRNLAVHTTQDVLERAFSRWGEVLDAKIISDRETGRQRGFAFVVMATREAAKEAALRMDGTDVEGRRLRVNATRDPKPRSSGPSTGHDRGGASVPGR
jgi:RNA recognition motif-containing protein